MPAVWGGVCGASAWLESVVGVTFYADMPGIVAMNETNYTNFAFEIGELLWYLHGCQWQTAVRQPFPIDCHRQSLACI